MSGWILTLPVVIPLGAAAASLLTWSSLRMRRALDVIGAAGTLAASAAIFREVHDHGVIATQIGNWPAPYGITLAADLFSAIMLVLTGMIGLAGAIYSLAEVRPSDERLHYHALLNTLLAGVCGAFLTGDLFNLYVWFEVTLIASFVLMALGGERPQIEGALKYVVMNLAASALLLSAVGMVYGTAGTLNIAELTELSRAGLSSPLLGAASCLFLISFGVKAAIFPFFFWLPASYHTPPAAVSAVFAGLLTKVGVYALIRLFAMALPADDWLAHRLILAIAAATMIVGVLGALAQLELRRLLSFHIVSQIGYMIMGLGLQTKEALAAAIFYIGHHILVKSNLFFVSGIVYRLRGSYHIKELGGLYERHPWTAVLFLVPALSLAGAPPLSGFFAKFWLIRESLSSSHWVMAGVALAVGLLTLLSMTKIWTVGFLGKAPENAAPTTLSRHDRILMYTPAASLAALTVGLGIFAGPLIELAERAAAQLADPSEYLNAVLKATP